MVFFVFFFWRRHYYRWRAENFDQCPSLMAVDQLGFYIVPHLLWHGGVRLYWSFPRTLDTHTYVRSFGSGAVTTCFYDSGPRHELILKVCRNSFFSLPRKRSSSNCTVNILKVQYLQTQMTYILNKHKLI